MNVAPGFVAAYTPDQNRLKELESRVGPAQGSLGAAAIRRQQMVDYDTYQYDLVGHPDDGIDPRFTATTAGEGYVDEEAFTVHADPIAQIDAHYASLLTDDFYEKHHLEPGTPLSHIVRETTRKNPDGNFAMARDDYFNLLKDMQVVHEQESQAFAERLPFYKQDYAARLEANGLGRLVEKFNSRVETAHIYYDDGFDTLARGGAGRHERHGDNFTIVMGPLPSREHRVIMHEFTHLLEGNDIARAFPDTPHVVTALRESVAAHMVPYMQNGGDIQDINPDLPGRETTYYTYRRMLDLFCNGGKRPISVHQVIDALDAEVGENSDAGQRLHTEITESFSDHPTLLEDLETMLGTMHASENVRITAHEQRVIEFIDEIQEHYKPVVVRATRLSRLLRKIPWLGRT